MSETEMNSPAEVTVALLPEETRETPPNSDLGEAVQPPVSEEKPDVTNAPVVAAPEPQGAVAPFPEEVSINDLQEKGLGELLALAETLGWRTNASRTKHQLIYDLLVWMGQHKTRLRMEGLLEIGSDNFGLIRYPKYSFSPLPEDVFVPLFLVRKFQLQPGQRINGYAKAPREKEKYLAIDRIVEIEGKPIDSWVQLPQALTN